LKGRDYRTLVPSSLPLLSGHHEVISFALCRDTLPHHRPKSREAKRPWTVSLKKKTFHSYKFIISGVCYSNRTLTKMLPIPSQLCLLLNRSFGGVGGHGSGAQELKSSLQDLLTVTLGKSSDRWRQLLSHKGHL
jgi:hypothetical protein